MILHGIVVTKNIFETTLNFNKDLYLNDIKLIDWHEILNPEKNVNEKVQEALNTLNNIVEKHALIKLQCSSQIVETEAIYVEFSPNFLHSLFTPLFSIKCAPLLPQC